MKPKTLLNKVILAIEEKKGTDIKTLDVAGQTVLTDYFVVCSADSTTQARAIAENIIETAEDNGLNASSREGQANGEWVVIDLKDVIVHIFLPEVREFYALEKFWEEEIDSIHKDAYEIIEIKTKKEKPAAGEKPRQGKKAAKGEKETKASAKTKKTAASKKAAGAKVKKETIYEKAEKSKISVREAIEEELLMKKEKAAAVKKSAATKAAPEKPAKAKVSAAKTKKELIEEEILKNKAKETAKKNKKSGEKKTPEKNKKAVR